MAELNFAFDNRGRIPTDVKKTLGTLEVLKVLEPKIKFEDGESTGEISERPVEFLSAAVGGSVVISFDPGVDTAQLKTFDQIELEDDDTDVIAWANIDPNAFGNFAESDVKIRATKFRKVNAVMPNPGKPQQENKDIK